MAVTQHYLSRHQPDRFPLWMALLISLVLHLFGAAVLIVLAMLGVMVFAPAELSPEELKAAEAAQKQQLANKPQEQTIFIEVMPEQAVVEAPKETPFYSTA